MQLRNAIHLGYYSLEIFFAILGFSTAFELNSSNTTIREEGLLASSVGTNRRLQTAECTLLLKVITYKDGHVEKQVDCYDVETKSYLKVTTMQRDVDIQSELLSKFETGALKSAESTMTVEAFVDGNSLILPKDGLAKASFGRSPNSRRRRLAHAVSGSLTFLAVRVVGPDLSPTFSTTDISDSLFGSYGQQLTFKSQAEACSNNAFSVSKFQAPGVTEGVMEITVSDMYEDNYHVAVVDEVVDVVDNLPVDNFPDYLVLCYPQTTGDWAAWAYADGSISVYMNTYCLETCAQMHEIGHNWNLGHALYNEGDYGDESGVMGGVCWPNTPKCYNAAYNTQLGFYSDKTVQVTSSWSGKLYGLSSYQSAGPNDAIILHIPKGTNGFSKDYYVSFNGASGINRDTQTGPDKVLVHKHHVYTDNADSTLVTIMESGKSYYGAPLKITVNFISGSTFAEVTIGTGVDEDYSCIDFPDTFKFTKTKIVSCEEMTPYRCSKNKGKSLCPNACGTTASWCSRDAKGQFEYGVDGNGETIYKGCPFVRRQPEKIASRCSKGNVAVACRATCSNY